MRKQGIGLTSELESWAYVDDITIATTAELAPRVMDRLKEILERHGLELRSDKCTAYCPTPGRADGVREEMTRFVKWTPDGLMILPRLETVERPLRVGTGPRLLTVCFFRSTACSTPEGPINKKHSWLMNVVFIDFAWFALPFLRTFLHKPWVYAQVPTLVFSLHWPLLLTTFWFQYRSIRK